jgi:predicted transcriptional regulator
MRLSEYLERTGESQAEFAKRARLPQSVVSRVASGRDASGENWAKITEATAGKVQPRDHFPPDSDSGVSGAAA